MRGLPNIVEIYVVSEDVHFWALSMAVYSSYDPMILRSCYFYHNSFLDFVFGFNKKFDLTFLVSFLVFQSVKYIFNLLLYVTIEF